MHFSLDPRDPASVAAAIALRESRLPYEWLADASSLATDWRGASILCSTKHDRAKPTTVRMNCVALLEMLAPGTGKAEALEAAEIRTFVHLGVNLLNDLAAHSRGDPELPLSRHLMQLIAALEARISGPVWGPERFTYIPSEFFDGEGVSSMDCVYAAVFLTASKKLPLDSLMTGSPRVAAWKQAILQRDSVCYVRAENRHLTR